MQNLIPRMPLQYMRSDECYLFSLLCNYWSHLFWRHAFFRCFLDGLKTNMHRHSMFSLLLKLWVWFTDNTDNCMHLNSLWAFLCANYNFSSMFLRCVVGWALSVIIFRKFMTIVWYFTLDLLQYMLWNSVYWPATIGLLKFVCLIGLFLTDFKMIKNPTHGFRGSHYKFIT